MALGLIGLLLFGVSRAAADPPVFDPVSDQTLEATSSAGAVATFAVTATDDNPSPTIVCDHNSGATFPIGVTPVLCTATDTVTGEVTGPVNVLTITVQDTTPPSISTPGNITAEATSIGGTTVTYSTSATDIVDGSVTPVCAPPSGSAFVLGTTTTVNCTATDSHGNSASASFSVSVVDTTPPTLSNMPANISTAATGPGGAVVSYTPPSATDTVDGIPTVACAPPSGSTFPVGTTTVSCTASDHSGNTSAAQTFTVTVTDNVAPTFSNVPSSLGPFPAANASGAPVSYTPPTATDNVDGPVPVTCDHASGSVFPVGTTTVTCSATDSSGNTASATFTITVSDTTAPTINASNVGPIEATGPGGAPVSFNVTASDNVDPSPTVNCSPASGSTFALGSTTVNCTAKDAANNQSSASFTVTVVDTTPPAFSNVPSLPTFEAINAGGSAVSYVAPTAVDLVSGAVPVTCSPASGSGFGIGTTTVDCQAHDASGNIGHASFTIRVADRTPPVISAPPSLTLYATTPTGVPASDPSVAAADRFITAQDNIDPNPVVTSDMPDFLPLGHTLVHFFASDRYGNRSGTNMDINVIPKPPGTPPPLPPPDVKPPANVANLTARGGNRSVALSWKLPGDNDLDHVGVYRSEPTAAGLGTPVYSGKAAKFTDKGLTNDTQYRYVVVTYDKTGNRSAGMAILATPHVLKLLRPLDGAAVKKPPVFVWRADAEADYYNLQLFRDSGKALAGSISESAVKILSVWPKGTRFALKAQWKFQGKKYKLTKGTYRWFVWPGFGSRAQNSYGTLLGENTFRVTR